MMRHASSPQTGPGGPARPLPRRLVLLAALLAIAGPAYPESATVPPNENLLAEGIPAVPATLATTVAKYGNFRTATFETWNPTAREMLISTRFADVVQLHTVKFPGGARSQITFFPEPVASASYRPVKGDYFIFTRDTGGAEQYQIYREDVASGDVTLLTDGKSRNSGAVWTRDGARIAYGSTRRDGNDVDLWVMDPADPKTDHLVAPLPGGGWQAMDWTRDGRQLLLQNYLSAEESYLYLVDAATGQKTLLTPKEGKKVSYGAAGFSADGKGLFVTTDRDSEFHRLAYLDLATAAYTYLTPAIPWDIDELALSDDGRKLAFVANEDGYGVLHLLDTGTLRELPIPTLPRGVISGVSWHPNNRDLAFSLTSARSGGDVYSLDVESQRVDRWTTSELGGLNPAALPEPDLVHWKSWDGRMISGFLLRPAPTFPGKRPVIIAIHGGPEAQDRPTFFGRSNYWTNELGVAVIFPNVRGSSGYGKTFVGLDNGFLREGSYQDINALFDWIKAQPDLDPDRVMVTGGSYGGFMTLAVATSYNDRIRCSVDIVGPSNLVTFLEHTSGYRQDLRRVEYGDERDPKMRAFLERIAPANHAKNITKPIFIIAGKNDPRVPASESQQMVTAVRANGTPVWWLLGKNEGHGFRKKANVDFQFYATVLFVQQYLLN